MSRADFPKPATIRKPVNGVVPAVERSAAILRYLQENAVPAARTLSRIARELEINKSTCSNILRTLETGGLVEYDPDSRSFQLGPELIGLGGAAAKSRNFLQVGLRHLERLVAETGLTCVMFEQLPNMHFVIVAKIDSPRDIKVTIDVGQHFHPATPALARMAMACKSSFEVDSYLSRWGLQKFTPHTKTSRSAVLTELKKIRERGYAVSKGEYYAANTAIGAPVFAAHSDVCRGLCLVAFSSEIPDDAFPIYGEKVRAAAEAITRALGGRSPERFTAGKPERRTSNPAREHKERELL